MLVGKLTGLGQAVDLSSGKAATEGRLTRVESTASERIIGIHCLWTTGTRRKRPFPTLRVNAANKLFAVFPYSNNRYLLLM